MRGDVDRVLVLGIGGVGGAEVPDPPPVGHAHRVSHEVDDRFEQPVPHRGVARPDRREPVEGVEERLQETDEGVEDERTEQGVHGRRVWVVRKQVDVEEFPGAAPVQDGRLVDDEDGEDAVEYAAGREPKLNQPRRTRFSIIDQETTSMAPLSHNAQGISRWGGALFQVF